MSELSQQIIDEPFTNHGTKENPLYFTGEVKDRIGFSKNSNGFSNKYRNFNDDESCENHIKYFKK